LLNDSEISKKDSSKNSSTTIRRDARNPFEKSSRVSHETNLNSNLIQQQFYEHLQSLQNSSSFYFNAQQQQQQQQYQQQAQQHHSPTTSIKNNFFHIT
jgi:hypothetical protein